MGWLFTYNSSKTDLIKGLIAPEEDATRRWATIAHCVRGNVVWSVVEVTAKSGDRSKRLIVCHLLAQDKDGGWGYKAIEESMRPNYYSCPLRYLDLAPVTNGDWRCRVERYHRYRNRTLKIGQRVAIQGSVIPWVIITSLRPLTGEYGGRRYRVPRRRLGAVL